MLKRFQNSCGRQHRQEPLLHNSKLLFSWQKCVLSSADEKWGWVSRYEHKEIWRICMLITHTFFQCPAGHQNSLCLCCKGTAVKSSRVDGKLWQGKRRPRGKVENTSHWKNHSSTLVCFHPCLKMPTQLPYSAVSCWDGLESGWMVMGGQEHSQLLKQCCRIFCESKDKDLARTRHAHQVTEAYSAAECLPFLCAVWAWSCCRLRTVTNTG